MAITYILRDGIYESRKRRGFYPKHMDERHHYNVYKVDEDVDFLYIIFSLSLALRSIRRC